VRDWCQRAFLPIILLCTGCSVGCNTSETEWPYTVELGGTRVNVEVASTPAECARGLMFRDRLGENWGMLFVYGKEQRLSFWMKNTTIPLSIAFIDREGVVRDIQDMTPLSEEPHTAGVPVPYALEVNRGWFARHGVVPGTTVGFSPKLEALTSRKH